MGRITKPPQNPKVKHLFEVRIAHTGQWGTRQDELWAKVKRIAGLAGHKIKKPFWGCTAVYFDTDAKAAELRRWITESHFERTAEVRKWVDPYDEVVQRQHAIIWGLSSGVMDKVVIVYRQRRATCTSHGGPNWEASSVIMEAAPTMSRDDARKMVDAMLGWVIARGGSWFWDGLEPPHIINRY